MSIENVDIEPDENSEIEQDEEYQNKYLFCEPMNYHLMSDAPEIESAARSLLIEIGYTETKRDKAYITMRMLICNLFSNYVSAPSRYNRTYLSKGGAMNLMRRYNKLEINYLPLRKCIAGLRKHEYIEYKRGYFNKVFKDGYQTRVRAEEKLIELLIDTYHLDASMMFEHPDQELIVKKTAPRRRGVTFKKRDGSIRKYRVKFKKLVDYDDDEHTKRWRRFIIKYIAFLKRTYIDIDLKRYEPDPNNPIDIDPSERTIRRIFSHGVFTKGGRLYGGWWQKLPERLRDRIILNGQHIIEIDFSGMMVHILYAMVGKLMGNREPYVIAKSDDPEQKKLRDLYKKLMVAGCNADGKSKAIGIRNALYSVRKHISKNKDDYPVVPEEDKACYVFLKSKMDELKAYHPDIAHFVGSGVGIRTQRVDSDIVYKLLVNMTEKNIPVLSIHDSFICRTEDHDVVFAALKQAYVDVINSLLLRMEHELRITAEDVITTESSIKGKLPKYLLLDRDSPYHVLNPLWSNNEQYSRQRHWMRTGCTQFLDIIKA